MSSRKKPRQLSQSEAELWQKVVKQVEAINPVSPLQVSQHPIPKKPQQPVFAVEHNSFRIGQKTKPSAHQKPAFHSASAKTSPNMDQRNFRRLLKGKLEIDGTLDLHGLTAEQARTRLHVYIHNAHRAHYRLLLVITGKGKMLGYDEFNRPKIGVLRQGLPEWLKSAELSSLVLQVTQAHDRHGGSGAYYVYLRRKR